MSNKIIGISLIEILITMIIISFAIFTALKFHNTISYNNDIAAQKNDAITIATKKLEEFRNITSIADYNAIVSGTENVTGTNTTYNLSWTVTTNTNPEYKTITLTTTWVDKSGTSNNIVLSTNIAELDPTQSANNM